MNPYWQNFALSMLICIPAIIGLVRYRAIDACYKPFVWVCAATTINELVRFLYIMSGRYDFITYNIALLFTTALYLQMFYRWHTFHRAKYPYWLLGGLLLIVWVADHFIISGHMLTQATIYYRLCYSITLVFLSVSTINKLIISERKNVLKSSKFLICSTLMVYYTYRIIIDAFRLNKMSDQFFHDLQTFNRYLVVGFSLIFTLAALWIPKKKNFTIRF